jgi:DNA-binding transcriptional MerR regulator
VTGTFTIGELAHRTGLTRDAIRFYERSGLLPRATRTRSGYRLYTERDAARARFVREAQAMGLTLDDVRELLTATELRTPEECRRVAELLGRRIREIDERMRAMSRFRRRLDESRRRCQRAGPGACPVVLDLEAAADVPGPDGSRDEL